MRTSRLYIFISVPNLRMMRKTLLTLIVNSTGNKAYVLTQELDKVKETLYRKTGEPRFL